MKRRDFIRVTLAASVCGGIGRRAAGGDKPAQAGHGELWKQALRERRVVAFSYHGFSREVEPHALGLLTDGKRAVHAYQTAGGSATEPPPGWRTFVVAEMKDVKLAEKTFEKPRADYRRGALKTIEAEVAGAETRGESEAESAKPK